MMVPPSFLWIAIKSDNKKGFKLWLPLFLVIWPFLFIAAGIVFLIWLVALVFLIWTKQGRQLLRIPFMLYEIICSFRGLTVDIKDKEMVQLIFI